MRLPLWDVAVTSAGSASGQALPSGVYPDFVNYPRCDALFRSIYDVSVAITPNGGLIGLLTTVAQGLGGAFWTASKTAQGQYIRGLYGIVNAPATATGSTAQGKCSIVVEGPANALIQRSSTTTVAPGTVLTADGAGNLIVNGNPAASNAVLAISLGTVSMDNTTSTPVLTPVWVCKGA